MEIHVNTDHHTSGGENVADYVRAAVAEAVGHLGDRITRVEVHLGDENGAKAGENDKRCMIEARVAKRQPIAVTHHAASLKEAIHGAAARLRRSLEHHLQKQAEHRR